MFATAGTQAKSTRKEQYGSQILAEQRLRTLGAEYYAEHSTVGRYVYRIRGGAWVTASFFLGKYTLEFFDGCPCG